MQYSMWGLHKSRVKGHSHVPHPAGHTSLDAAQDTVGFLGYKRTLLAHVELLTVPLLSSKIPRIVIICWPSMSTLYL